MAGFVASFQLYSSRNGGSVEQQLRGLSAIGFTAVETYGGAYGDDPVGFRHLIDAAGLECSSAHIAVDRLAGDIDAVIAEAKSLGASTVVAPNLLNRPESAAGWRDFAEKLERFAQRLDRSGLALAWHNHAFEFVALPDGSRPIDHILRTPGLLWQADVGMVVKAGANPTSELARYGSRLHSLHAKDISAGAELGDGGWTDVGAGILDWPALWPQLASSPARLIVLEHDDPEDWRQFANNSLAYLRRLAQRDGSFIAMHNGEFHVLGDAR
jgi:sugar phosphate isomerase/epimerase